MLEDRFYTIDSLDEPIYYEFKDGVKQAVYVDSKKPLTLRKEYNQLQSLMLKNLNRKRAFSVEDLVELHQDSANGMSIRGLANKYNKSTRTIQKYLKIPPEEL